MRKLVHFNTDKAKQALNMLGFSKEKDSKVWTKEDIKAWGNWYSINIFCNEKEYKEIVDKIKSDMEEIVCLTDGWVNETFERNAKIHGMNMDMADSYAGYVVMPNGDVFERD